MSELPLSDELNIPALVGSFKDKTNSYKFYWFWSILEILSAENKDYIDYEQIAMRMLDLVWYPLDYYKLSFGKQDSFKSIAVKLSSNLRIDSHFDSKPIHVQVKERLDEKTANAFICEITAILKRYVGYRFLRSFVAEDLRGIEDGKVNTRIKELSSDSTDDSQFPYNIEDGGIRLKPQWSAYFKTNYAILLGFVKWRLLKFLQSHNPSVIGLSEKLEKPGLRDLKAARFFWTSYMAENETRCIYSKNVIDPSNLSLDHFIPWSYVVHDRLWNTIPTTKSINSAKSNTLPQLEVYLNDYCQLHYKAIQFHKARKSKVSLEDYVPFADIYSESLPSFDEFREKITKELEINIASARNIGFQYPFVFNH